VSSRDGEDAVTGQGRREQARARVARQLLRGPANRMILGPAGTGKTTLIMAMMRAAPASGPRFWIAGDVTGEYTPLIRSLGGTRIQLGAATGARINPLDPGPGYAEWASWPPSRQRAELERLVRRWCTLLTALTQARGYTATGTDETALAAALRHLSGATDGYTTPRPLTIPDLAQHLARPDDALVTASGLGRPRQFADTTRQLTNALFEVIYGELFGLFDAPTTITPDWSAPAQSLDLSQHTSHTGRTVGVALTCLGSWCSLMSSTRPERGRWVLVRDEASQQMRLGAAAVAALAEDLRLSRESGTSQIVVALSASVAARSPAHPATAQIARVLGLCPAGIRCGQPSQPSGEGLGANPAGAGRPLERTGPGSVMDQPHRSNP
jgi:hypothetical protein